MRPALSSTARLLRRTPQPRAVGHRQPNAGHRDQSYDHGGTSTTTTSPTPSTNTTNPPNTTPKRCPSSTPRRRQRHHRRCGDPKPTTTSANVRSSTCPTPTPSGSSSTAPTTASPTTRCTNGSLTCSRRRLCRAQLWISMVYRKALGMNSHAKQAHNYKLVVARRGAPVA